MKKSELKAVIKECLTEESLKNPKFHADNGKRYSIAYSKKWSEGRANMGNHITKLIGNFEKFINDYTEAVRIYQFSSQLEDNRGGGTTDGEAKTGSLYIGFNVAFVDENGDDIPKDDVSKETRETFITDLKTVFPNAGTYTELHMKEWQGKLSVTYRVKMDNWNF